MGYPHNTPNVIAKLPEGDVEKSVLKKGCKIGVKSSQVFVVTIRLEMIKTGSKVGTIF